MTQRWAVLALTFLLLLSGIAQANPRFSLWKEQFAAKLRRDGFSEATVAYFLANAEYREAPLLAQTRQPEKTILFEAYRRNLLTPQRISAGYQALSEQGPQIAAVAARFGIEPEILAALWGIESSYGRNLGKQPVISSLATLAFNGKRRSFFEKELIAALRMASSGNLPPDHMVGSWAGAMGHYQFIPTTSERFALDGDGDCRIDLYGSFPDALVSAGNYLSSLGWRKGDSHIHAVDRRKGLALFKRDGGKAHYRTAAHWKKAGLLLTSQRNDMAPLKLVVVDNGQSGCYLVGEGFDRLKDWNRSTYFALTVLLLAEQLAAPPALESRH